MRKFLLIVLFALPLSADTTVTLLHFSDYHSHALPFAAEEGERGGIARAIRYLRAAKRDGALVFVLRSSRGRMRYHGPGRRSGDGPNPK